MMRTQWVLLVVVGLLAFSDLVQAQEAYQIKVKKSQKGDRSAVEKTETDDAHTKVVGPGGQVVNEEKKKTTTTVAYEETVLEKEKGVKKATRLSRKYEKAERTVDGKTEALAYQGKTVLIEKKSDEYHFKIEGGDDIMGKDAEELNKEFNRNKNDEMDYEELLLPKEPVKLKGTWKVNPDGLAKAFEKAFEVDKAKASGTGKLLRVYRKDGHQFGEIEFTLDLPIKGSLKLGDAQKAELEPGARIKAEAKGDLCIDGSLNTDTTTSRMSIDIKATLKGPDGNDYKLNVTSAQTGKSSTRDLGKK